MLITTTSRRAVVIAAFAACPIGCAPDHPDIQCIGDQICNRFDDGQCLVYEPTGRTWCSYPDDLCPSGRRWSDLDVGDGLEATCIAGEATLSELTVSAGVLDPAFDPDVAEYDLDLLLAEDEVTFTATPSVASGVITIDGAEVDAGEPSTPRTLAPGSVDVVIIIETGDGSLATYRVHVHRGVDVLAALDTSLGAIQPKLDAEQTAYSVGCLLDQTTATITATLLIPDRAALVIQGEDATSGSPSTAVALAPGSNRVTVEVTPLTRPARVYEIDVGRGTDALGSIELSYAGGELTNTLNPAIDPATSAYSVDVGLWVQRVQVAVQLLIAGGTISVSGGAVLPGEPSTAVALNLGLTSIPIVVTAPDGTQRTYSLAVNRASTAAQQAYVKASNTDANDRFGGAIAIWGDTLAVSAAFESSAATGIGGIQTDDSASASGAVYVFTRVGSAWVQQAYLKASNTEAGDEFGGALALWEDTLAVGASFEGSASSGVNGNQADNGRALSGAAYVFTRSGSTWSQQAYVKASNPGYEDHFGSAVAIWGDTLVIGAINEYSASTGINGDQSDDSAEGAGAAYVFVRSKGIWSQQAYLKASNAAFETHFGSSVAVWGNTIAVGSVGEASGATGIGGDQTDVSAGSSGAVYVFARSGSQWTQQAYVKASNHSGHFGTSVALWNNTLAAGASAEESSGIGVNGSQSNYTTSNSGAAYVFERDGSTWSQQAYIKATNPDVNDRFGSQIALWGDTLAVSAPNESSAAFGVGGDQANDTCVNAGAVYVFKRTVSIWASQSYVKASNTNANDFFGTALSIWGDTIAVGARGEASSGVGVGANQADNTTLDSGAAYVLR